MKANSSYFKAHNNQTFTVHKGFTWFGQIDLHSLDEKSIFKRIHVNWDFHEQTKQLKAM